MVARRTSEAEGALTTDETVGTALKNQRFHYLIQGDTGGRPAWSIREIRSLSQLSPRRPTH